MTDTKKPLKKPSLGVKKKPIPSIASTLKASSELPSKPRPIKPKPIKRRFEVIGSEFDKLRHIK